MKLIFFDTETTGIKPGSICQLSYIVVDTGHKPYNIYANNVFFSVDYVEPGAQEVHGFSVEMLEELSLGKTFREKIDEFMCDFEEADVLIGHNVNFDIKFLTSELTRCGIEFTPKGTFDTMKYYLDICKLKGRGDGYKLPKLCEVAQFLNLTDDRISDFTCKFFDANSGFHDARYDVTTTYLLVTDGIRRGYIPHSFFSNKYCD